MKIKTKLTISFCIIIFVPIFLATIALIGFQSVQMKAIEQTYGIRNADPYSWANSVQLLNGLTEDCFEELKDTARKNPSKLEDYSFLYQTNKELKEKYSYLLVLKDSEIFYNGNTKNKNLIKTLNAYAENPNGKDTDFYNLQDEEALIKQINFKFEDEDKGSLYIITSTASVVPGVKKLLISMIIAMVMILLFTACMMIIWIYRAMITPIRKLQVAAENIKEGNLDFHIEASGEDEIGQLCTTFEEMRQRLMDNAEEKINNEKENRTLISNIAHDLKTPITAVKGYSEGILDGVANTPEKLDKYVRTIFNKANEMDTLINELTLYTKIDTNKIPYNFAKITVADYFSDCVEEIGLDLESKNINLSYANYVDEKVIIIADPEQLRRVINNIVGNSIKYMNDKEKFINIRIKDVGDFIQVEIEDNGRGIAKKDLPYIFDRFYRADASRNSATGGSGIGLSIVKKIIEDHGGKIWATSKENIGTIMYFVIRKYQEVINE
ncbi:MAG: HAMP domain-containing sensor histidine kinase [Agathobacter sp.]|nr:HAMP domain-containing sensor histidine kinase [Agathobacter sp.]